MGNKLTDADKKTWLTEAKQLLGTPREWIPKVTETAKAPETVKPLGKGKAPANPNPKPNPNPANPNPKVELNQLSDLRGGTPGKKRKFSPDKTSQVSSNESSQEMSSDEETLSLPGTPEVVKSPGNGTVKLYPRPDRSTININIKPTCELLVLGDTSLDMGINHLECIQVIRFPRATFSDFDWVLKQLEPLPNNVTYICLATAANYNEETFESKLVPEFNDLMETLEQMGTINKILEIPIPSNFYPEGQHMLKKLNDHIKNVEGVSFIPGTSTLPTPLGISKMSTYGVVYDRATSEELTEGLISYFYA
jgi:hypothetical protein